MFACGRQVALVRWRPQPKDAGARCVPTFACKDYGAERAGSECRAYSGRCVISPKALRRLSSAEGGEAEHHSVPAGRHFDAAEQDVGAQDRCTLHRRSRRSSLDSRSSCSASMPPSSTVGLDLDAVADAMTRCARATRARCRRIAARTAAYRRRSARDRARDSPAAGQSCVVASASATWMRRKNFKPRRRIAQTIDPHVAGPPAARRPPAAREMRHLLDRAVEHHEFETECARKRAIVAVEGGREVAQIESPVAFARRDRAGHRSRCAADCSRWSLRARAPLRDSATARPCRPLRCAGARPGLGAHGPAARSDRSPSHRRALGSSSTA